MNLRKIISRKNEILFFCLQCLFWFRQSYHKCNQHFVGATLRGVFKHFSTINRRQTLCLWLWQSQLSKINQNNFSGDWNFRILQVDAKVSSKWTSSVQRSVAQIAKSGKTGLSMKFRFIDFQKILNAESHGYKVKIAEFKKFQKIQT